MFEFISTTILYCLWANFWDLQSCSLFQSIWINFASSVFDLLWSRLSHFVIFSSTVSVILLKSYHVCGLWSVLFLNNPGLMQPLNSFVFLGCVQFINPSCRKAIKNGRSEAQPERGGDRGWISAQAMISSCPWTICFLILRPGFLVWKMGGI